MTKKIIDTIFDWNTDYIENHTLSTKLIEAAGIELMPSEIFVRLPEWDKYYFSQYGRGISLQDENPKLLKSYLGGTNKDYYYYTLYDERGFMQHRTISVHRAVAEIFCPNFWKNGTKLEAHHIDRERSNNFYRNIILLPVQLHRDLHKIKKIVRLENGKIIEYRNLLDLVKDTNLTLEQIILANKGKRKPVKSTGGYTVFKIKGHYIGYQYYPEKKKSEKAKKG